MSLAAKINAWRHSTRSIGGYWDGGFSIRAGPSEMENWVQNGLGRHVVTKDDALVPIWEGFVNQITITAGPISIVFGPLMETANRVAVTYSTLENNVYGARQTTETIDDEDAQAKYGIIEERLSVSGASSPKADQIRDTFLAENAWPAVTHDIEVVEHEPNIVVDCLGYVQWLRKVVYEQIAETGDVYLEDKLKSVILSEPNGFFDIGIYSLLKELLLNTNFEAEGAGGADIWADWTEVVGDGSLNRITTDHKEGDTCVAMVSGATSNTQIRQNFTVEAGKAYRLTFWTRDLDNDTLTGIDDSGIDNKAFLQDSTIKFDQSGVRQKQIVQNTTDGSEAVITDVIHEEEHRVYGILESLAGENDWDTGDGYSIVTGAYPGRYFIYDNTNGSFINPGVFTSEFGNTSWHKVTEIFYAPEGCVNIQVALLCSQVDTKQVYFDAVSIKEYSEVMASQTSFVPAYEDSERNAWAVIKELIGYGDYQDHRYNWGVYADRKIKFGVMPTETKYTMSALDVGSGYKTMEGGRVEEYNVVPGEWLLITDILTGITDVSLRRNPKTMFIEEVRYSASQGLTINPGKYGTVNQTLAKLGLVGT